MKARNTLRKIATAMATPALAALLALSIVQTAHAQARQERDPYTQGARSDKFDPYTQGANSGTRTDLAPAGKVADPYTDGAKTGARDPYTDGARVGARDPHTDGARTGARNPYVDGAKKD